MTKVAISVTSRLPTIVDMRRPNSAQTAPKRNASTNLAAITSIPPPTVTYGDQIKFRKTSETLSAVVGTPIIVIIAKIMKNGRKMVNPPDNATDIILILEYFLITVRIKILLMYPDCRSSTKDVA